MWELDWEESWVLTNWCFWTMVLEKTIESPLECKAVQPVHPKGDSLGCSLQGLMLKLKLPFFGHIMWRVDHWKRPWCWEGLGAGGEGDDRGWDGWMASPTLCTWVWVNSGSWCWTGRPCVLWFMGSQRVGHDWATELNWTLYSPSDVSIMHRLTNFILFHWSCVLLLFFFFVFDFLSAVPSNSIF